MAIPTNREEFINYCIRKLGEPVIKVNVAVEQVEDRVDEALYKFYERNYYAVEPVFMLYNISDADVNRGYIVLPSDVVGVVDVFRPIGGINFSSIEFQSFLQDIYSASSLHVFGNLSYYYMQMMNMSLLNSFFAPARQYNFNSLSNKLIVAGGLANAQNVDGALIVRGFRKLLGELPDEGHDTNVEIHNIWKNKWLQDYATALIKRQWATNLGKYGNVQLLGGVSMNGEQLWQQADTEIEKLELQLKEEFEEPPGFIVG